MAKYIGNIPSVGEFKKLDSLTSTFNGSLTQFDLEYGSTSVSVGDASQLIVSLNGIIQEPLTAYTLAVGGSAIVFSSAPASTDTCHIILLGGVGGTSTVSDGAVTAAKLDAGLKDYLEETYTANGSQTTYTLTRAPIGTNDLMITIDGIVQPSTAYSIAGTTLTISPALPNGTDVRVVHMGVRAGFVVPSSSTITAAMFQDFTTDVKFNDNAKAVFGTGDDLEIYHDGSHSYVKDVGTGNLKIQGENVSIENTSGDLALYYVNTGVNLYHNNSAKLATTSTGVDVTGTVTADGLNVQNGSNAGITFDLTTNYTPVIKGSQSVSDLYLEAVGGGGFRVSTTDKPRLFIQNNGDISFYEDTGVTAKFFWDASAERLGIGATAPIEKLHVTGQLISTGSNSTSATAGAERAIMDLSAFSATDHSARFGHFRGTNTAGAGQLRLYTDSVERARIDASGNLLVGKTVTAQSTPGTVLYSNGQIYNTASGSHPLVVTRNTNDGALSLFYKDTNEVGRIAANGGSIIVGSGNTGLYFDDGSDRLIPVDPVSASGRDNAINLGGGSERFKDLYLSGGVYLGGTGSANKLDEYEEGDWTCVLSPSSGFTATSNSVTGKYVKVGDLVFVTAVPTMTTPASLGSWSNGSTGHAVRVTGLPYNVGSYGVQGRSAPVIGVAANIGYVSGDILAGHGSEGSNHIEIFCNRPNGGVRRSPTLYASGTANFHLSFTYRI